MNAVRWALYACYRHIDTTQAYGNEQSDGRGLCESGVPREEVFITTKFYPANQDPVAAIAKSVNRLRVDRGDLYIIHWPRGGPTWAWPGIERARELGYARVGQVQFSPYEYGRGILAACEQSGVPLEAYSPPGQRRHISSEAGPGSHSV